MKDSASINLSFYLTLECYILISVSGYAGRTDLPDNLKSMFRPIAMVSPDSTLIAEIILFGEGFNNCKGMARKTYTLYSLAEQQLSKQDHYDFGLRALVSVLRYAGPKRRTSPNLSDEEVGIAIFDLWKLTLLIKNLKLMK